MLPPLKRLLMALALLGLGQSAQADFAYAYVTDQSSVSLQIGDTFALDVYLQETVTGADTPRFTGAGNGLFSAAVAVNFGASSAARVLNSSDVTPNTAEFADTLATGLLNAGTAQINEQVPLSSTNPVAGTIISPGVSRILVGSFLFTAIEAGTFSVSLTDLNSGLDDIIAADGFVVDSPTSNLQAGTVRFSVGSSTVVPEPSSLLLALAGLGGVAGLKAARGVRRRTV